MNDAKISQLLAANPLSGGELIPVDQMRGPNSVYTTVKTTPAAIRDYIKATVDFVPTGSIMPYAGVTAPTGWLMCNGSSIPRNVYTKLFNVIGIHYGSIDSTTFKLPNLIGRVIVGHNASSSYTPAFGNWSSNDTFAVGVSGGEFYHRLTVGEIPAHDHNLTDPGHTHRDPKGNPLKVENYNYVGYDPNKDRGGGNRHTRVSVIPNATTGITIDPAGGNQMHNNMQPYLILNYIIKY